MEGHFDRTSAIMSGEVKKKPVVEDIREERLIGLEEKEIVMDSEKGMVTDGDGRARSETKHGFSAAAAPFLLSFHSLCLSRAF